MAGFLKWLFNRASGKPEIDAPRLARGAFFEIVGESGFQRNLEKICGGKGEFSAEHQCKAILLPEPTNAQDSNAVQVRISGWPVGYLARDHAVEYHHHIGARASSCDAKIVGGWKDADSEGSFGVKLKIKWPPRLAKIK